MNLGQTIFYQESIKNFFSDGEPLFMDFLHFCGHLIKNFLRIKWQIVDAAFVLFRFAGFQRAYRDALLQDSRGDRGVFLLDSKAFPQIGVGEF